MRGGTPRASMVAPVRRRGSAWGVVSRIFFGGVVWLRGCLFVCGGGVVVEFFGSRQLGSGKEMLVIERGYRLMDARR